MLWTDLQMLPKLITVTAQIKETDEKSDKEDK